MLILQVDAFTETAFRGNPAAVCLLDRPVSDRWMAAVAQEMNLAETAFLERRPDGWGLRWFTPAVEVDLCGHATLASAHALWETGLAPTDDTIRFHTRSGVLSARYEPSGIVLDFPSQAPVPLAQPWTDQQDALDALGVAAPRVVARYPFGLMIELDDAEQVRSLAPDMTRLAGQPFNGIIVTARADDGQHDFISRFFAPRVGVPEDPVTGSAHCCLAPWWSERLGRTELRGYQASRRGGTVTVRVRDDRIHLIGRAVTILRGDLQPTAVQTNPNHGERP